MPLLYGEGRKAFRRLQEEIVNQSNDLTIFAWNPPGTSEYCSVLAPSPASFIGRRNVERFNSNYFDPEFALNNKGLCITASLCKFPIESSRARTLRYLLRLGSSSSSPTGVFLTKAGPGFSFRDGRMPLRAVSESDTRLRGLRTSEIYVATEPPKTTKPVDLTSIPRISFAVPVHRNWEPVMFIPEEFWDDSNNLFFGAVNHILQILEVLARVPGTGIDIPVVALRETHASPVTCLIFNVDDEKYEPLARYLLHPRHVNERLRMRELLWDFPAIEELKDHIIVTVAKETCMIKAVMQLGIIERISATTPIYSLAFKIGQGVEVIQMENWP